MTEQTPAYWNDVLRNYGELISSALPDYEGNFIWSEETRAYDWPAQEKNVRAFAVQRTYRALGGIIAHTDDMLALRKPTDPPTHFLDHLIIFDPRKQHVRKVQDQIFIPGREDTLSDHLSSCRDLYQSRKTGLLKPTPEDYDLLLNEIRRGAIYRSFEVTEDS